MPIREYQARDPGKNCDFCRKAFEQIERSDQKPIKQCPQCGSQVVRIISKPAVGASKSGFDDQAKHAGFHKLKKVSHGEYEKKY